MTGSSRKEREEGDVDCIPPPPKRSSHRGMFNSKWTDIFRGLSTSLRTKRTDHPCYAGYAVSITKRPSEWSGLRFPCKLLRKDKLCDHKRSRCHTEVVQAEAIDADAKCSGGIAACLEEQVSLQRQAVRGVFKCMYWLAKEETAHHTKFSYLLQLAKSLGCSYFSELEIAQNANYTLRTPITLLIA